MRKVLVLLVAVLMPVAVMPAVAQAYTPKGGGTFNVPRPWGSTAERYRIVRHVDQAINRAQGPTRRYPDPTIHISTYLLDRGQSIDALISACRRGISVRVILDEDIVSKQSKRLVQALNSDNITAKNPTPRRGPCNRPLPGSKQKAVVAPLTNKQALASVAAPTDAARSWGKDKSYVKKCDGSCRGAGGNMHSKFYLFSRTGKARNVVMVSSSNLNAGGALNGWNDLTTMKGRPKSWQGYVAIHREMTADTRAGDGKVEIVDGPYTSRFFPMRRASKRNDPTLRDLNKIGCRGPLGRTEVNVSMFYWKGSRGDYLATKLLNLAGNGCRVNIVYGAPSVAIAERLRNAARANRINLYDSRWDFNNDNYNEVRTHAKYVLVRGRYGKQAKSWQVLTGSQNWVKGSLSRGDETTLNIASRGAWKQYHRNWTAIRNHSRKLPYNR